MATKKSTWKTYEDYLTSDEWHAIREEAMDRDKWKCRLCGAKAEQVHHHKYPGDWHDDEVANVISVCSLCHKRTHGLAGRVPSRKAYQRHISVGWVEGLDLVIGGEDSNGNSQEIVIDESQIDWLISEIVDIRRMQPGEEDRPTIQSIAEITLSSFTESRSLRHDIQKLLATREEHADG